MATLTVPSEQFPSIQSAIDAASPGDVVKLHPGNYNEQVVFKGSVTVEGTYTEPGTTIQHGSRPPG